MGAAAAKWSPTAWLDLAEGGLAGRGARARAGADPPSDQQAGGQPLTLARGTVMIEQIANDNAAERLHAIIKQTMLQNLLVMLVDAGHAAD